MERKKRRQKWAVKDLGWDVTFLHLSSCACVSPSLMVLTSLSSSYTCVCPSLLLLAGLSSYTWQQVRLSST